MAVDILEVKILFVAEIENNSLDIIDLNAGKRIHSIVKRIIKPTTRRHFYSRI